MNEWFDASKQEEKLLGYMPTGKVYKNAHKKNTNFNRFIKWTASGFDWLVEEYNKSFMGLYVCESDYLLSMWKKEYGIPNGVFYEHSTENWKDVFVLRYLMRGNSEWNFRAIANIYGVDILVYKGYRYSKNSRLPNKVPNPLRNISKGEDVIVIAFANDDFKNPEEEQKEETKKLIKKIKAIYATIKEAQLKIVYMPLQYDIKLETEKNKVPTAIPSLLGRKVNVTNTPIEYEVPTRLKFHLGVEHEEFH